MTITFRGGFFGGLALALCIGLYLIWLWGPERQVRLHTENFFHAIDHRNWEAVADFIGNDYHDQWGDDRARVLERMREGFRWIRGSRIMASDPAVQVDAPFELEWRRVSGKPWDWQLVSVSNSGFEIPADTY